MNEQLIRRRIVKKVRAGVAGMLVGLWLTGPITAVAGTISQGLAENGIEVEMSASMDYYSKYVWRGMLLDDDSVLQPGIEVSAGPVTAGFWGSWDVEAEDGLASDEVDAYLDYTFDLGFLGEGFEMAGMSFGHTWYSFPASNLKAREYYIGMSVDTFLSPSVTYYRDYSDAESGGADGEYYIASINHSLSLCERYGLSLDLGQEAGWNKNYFISGEGSYTLTTVGLSAVLSETATLSMSVGYSIPFGDLKKSDAGNQDKELYYGVGLALAF